MEDCIFCKIVRGEVPCEKIYEDSDFLAFMDISPVSKGHSLVMPKNHIRWMKDSPDKLISDIFILTKNLMQKMQKNLSCDYVQLSVMGEEINHFHIHLIPTFFNKKLAKWDKTTYESNIEMQDYAKKIRE